MISKCGNICSICPWGKWSRENLAPEDWDQFAAEVKKYVGYNPTTNPCQGCQTPNDELAKNVGVHNFLRGCSARECAFNNEFENCAYCRRYPCDKIIAFNLGNSREDAERRLGSPMPDDKYEVYVRVFQGMKTLDEIRVNLPLTVILEPKKVDIEIPKIVPFPDISDKVMGSKYKVLHNTLSTVITSSFGIKNHDVIAGQEMISTRREVFLKLLWIAACYGTIRGSFLSIDSISINTYKKGTSGFPTTEVVWKRYFDTLSTLGIRCEMHFAAIEINERTSPIGWLRERIPGTDEPVWFLKISLDKTLGGSEVLQTLKAYVLELEKKYDKRAFGTFKKVDMRFLGDQ